MSNTNEVTRKKGTTRVVTVETDPELLGQDLERYCQEAVAEGATAAKVIPADWVSVDERVRLKCLIPRCPGSGLCGECAPHGNDLELIRKSVALFSKAILIKYTLPKTEEIADFKLYVENSRWSRHYAKMARIVAKIETLAFADAHHLALGFPAGCCKLYLCPNEACQLIENGRCRNGLKARPSMEGSGMDVFSVTAKAGWDIYPIYKTVDPSQVPSASLIGVVFIC